ncbi:hypothetical protein M433DRAFT_261865 [Acidomyces richmondensis BFW]|nr:MAG: hypothetical protein FE78DRAFT_410473 [Acidomyces sp. 'richmondensis']KYG45325.1 hypothetical protein M433DRAFT_261865 [Acidomyces richmondensis BFW]
MRPLRPSPSGRKHQSIASVPHGVAAAARAGIPSGGRDGRMWSPASRHFIHPWIGDDVRDERQVSGFVPPFSVGGLDHEIDQQQQGVVIVVMVVLVVLVVAAAACMHACIHHRLCLHLHHLHHLHHRCPQPTARALKDTQVYRYMAARISPLPPSSITNTPS